MLDNTVTSLHHAFLFATLRAHWQSLEVLAKVTKSSVLLSSLTFVALHDGVTRLQYNGLMISLTGNLLLSFPHLLRLFPLPSLFLGHSTSSHLNVF